MIIQNFERDIFISSPPMSLQKRLAEMMMTNTTALCSVSKCWKSQRNSSHQTVTSWWRYLSVEISLRSSRKQKQCSKEYRLSSLMLVGIGVSKNMSSVGDLSDNFYSILLFWRFFCYSCNRDYYYWLSPNQKIVWTIKMVTLALIRYW